MACTLTLTTTGNEDYTAKTGSKFTLDLTGPANAGIVIVSMTYNATRVIASPFTFTAAAGLHYLFIHFEALVPGAKLQVTENCGGNSQVLETIFFDPGNPGTGYEIRSV